MSEIYADWNKLKNSAKHISTYAAKCNRFSNRINHVNQSLHMSSNISDTIKRKLRSDCERVEQIKREIDSFSSTLDAIADLYKTTEENLKK